MNKRYIFTIFATLIIFGPIQALGQSLVVVGWNIESGQSSDTAVAARIKEFQGVDIWGLSEVRNDDALRAAETAAEDGENADYKRLLSNNGGGDRLGIIYNAKRFTEQNHSELTDIGSGAQRAPLFVELKENDSGKKFIFMVNHLARGNNTLRHQQGRMLNDWVSRQTLPVIATGDYNFDWRVSNGDQSHDRGYDNMVAGGNWTWVRPAILIRSQCSPSFDSVLDFVFVNRPASAWNGRTEILTKANDCPANYESDMENPDHRPVRATFNMSGAANPTPNKDDILRKIEELERQLMDLKNTVRTMPE